jgi:hypothetical protein
MFKHGYQPGDMKMPKKNTLPAVSRKLKLMLWPNSERASFFVDRKINAERYVHSRYGEPNVEEALLMQNLEKIIGIRHAQIGGEEICLDLTPMNEVEEWLPEAINAISGYFGPTYVPRLIVSNRRYSVQPKYDQETGELISDGVKADLQLTVPFELFVED